MIHMHPVWFLFSLGTAFALGMWCMRKVLYMRLTADVDMGLVPEMGRFVFQSKNQIVFSDSVLDIVELTPHSTIPKTAIDMTETPLVSELVTCKESNEMRSL